MVEHVVRRSSLRPPPNGADIANRLLSALPRKDYRRILPHLEIVVTKPKQMLHKHGEPQGLRWYKSATGAPPK